MQLYFKSLIYMKTFKYVVSLLLIVTFINIVSAQKKEATPYSNFYTELILKKSSFEAFALTVLPVDGAKTETNFSESVDYAEFLNFENSLSEIPKNATPYLIELQIPFKGKTYNCLFEKKFHKIF